MTTPTSTDVLVVGAGPAGSAAAAWAARAGLDVVLADAAMFPRDKTCGDGLTPRAIGEMQKLGLEDWLRAHTVNQGLRAHGFGQTLLLPWPGPQSPGSALPDWGSAVARTELDDHLRTVAIKSGAQAIDGARAVGVRREGGRVAAVRFRGLDPARPGHEAEIACRWLVVADGVRSPLGKLLGREWHRDTVYAVAGRAYVDSDMSDDPWISSHLELRDEQGELVSGYGWIFPLGNGTVNLGAGTLATSSRPAEVAIKPLMQTYADTIGDDFGLAGPLRMATSALLPMGGAVTNVAGPNWALIGDAAACVNPLNGEGIDYGLETGRFVAEHISSGAGLGEAWRATLVEHYGESFSIARRLAGIATRPKVVAALGPAGMRSDWLMTLALRWMGNLVDEADRDRAARVWRWAGRQSMARDARPPFS
ncbi:geranylgeranyl reductase family protein [Nocardioides astragali]|uniref:Geranylgeranyl reductase family protein n=1 Tax=Nocardioides astragali TaxID=1776736 RepID=A0ABW2N748_9ACTN|nr:geranylgeranyl reductase family protein [Nocardioides astragali]